MIQPKIPDPDPAQIVEQYIEQLRNILAQHGIEYEFRGSASLLAVAQMVHGAPERAMLLQLAFQTATISFAIQTGLLPGPEEVLHG